VTSSFACVPIGHLEYQVAGQSAALFGCWAYVSVYELHRWSLQFKRDRRSSLQ